ncbi:MAG: hypothetical protein FJ119_07035 [Deltaproteobacteria bacterium]|nr:hypothetical protein [Deltaproteobacteria bacterium]
MNYFSRKDIVRLLAEKPDMMSAFPDYAVSPGLREQMAGIPGIALCDIAILSDHAAFERMCAAHTYPDAVLPAVIYTGVERVRLSACDDSLRELKKKLDRFLHVHMLPPVVLGAPSFRAALCMYAAVQTRQNICSALMCAACLFYRAAVCIPLCKQCGITRIWMAGIAPCCATALNLMPAPVLRTYCTILPKGYGITLDMTGVTVPVDADLRADDPDVEAALFDCCSRVPVPDESTRGVLSEELLQHYFETYAIPLASNVISTLLSGRPVDLFETARALLPADKKK